MDDARLDIVTQLQESLDRLSTALYSTAGALQRDAQPASVRGEPVKPLAKLEGSSELAKGWAAEVLALSQAVDRLIHGLPDVDSTEEEELKRVAIALEENDRVGAELRAETELTERILERVRTAYSALADVELAARAELKSSNSQAESGQRISQSPTQVAI